MRIIPVGDSITRGVGSTYTSHGYIGYRKPLYLTLIDPNNGYDVDFVGTQQEGDFAEPNHEGHGSWTDYDVAWGRYGYPNTGIYNWLVQNPADIILLHIGTNDIDTSPDDVEDILDEVDRYESDYNMEVTVLVARIIKRIYFEETVRIFNDNVQAMAQDRISNPNNPAYPDKIVLPNDVDMEHALTYPGDLPDGVHPNDTGYAKMANVWFDALDSVIISPLITSESITNAIVSQLYSYDVDANGYPEPTYELTTCPDGMTIDHNTGLIEWLPETAGDFNVTVEASNGRMPDANQSFVITASYIIKFDAASSHSSNYDGNTLSWQHTIGGDDKRILVVGIAGEDNDVNDLVISSVEYNDVNMTLVEGSSEIVSSDGNHTKTELYYLLDANLPSLLGDYTVTVTYNGNVEKRCGGAISLANVEQQDREAVATNSNVNEATISTNITTQTDNAWVVDVVGGGSTGSFSTPTNGMVERFDVNSDSSAAAGSTKAVGSAQQTTMSWAHSSANPNRLVHSAAAFAPATYIIAGCISEPNDAPVEGVSVLIDANVADITDANGYYEVLVFPGWSGMVTPIKDGRLFAPSKRTYSNVATNLLGQNYKDVSKYDLDGDKSIGWGDVEVMRDNWLVVGPNVPGDIYKDEDNIVNFLDFAEFAGVW